LELDFHYRTNIITQIQALLVSDEKNEEKFIRGEETVSYSNVKIDVRIFLCYQYKSNIILYL